MKIEFTNLYKATKNHKKINNKILDLIKKNQFIGGDPVKNFEKNFSNFVNSKYCIGVGNGTDALEIALESLNLPSKSEVIVPANTWISTAEIVVRLGHKVVFCDIDLSDYTILIEDLSKKINNKTRAIIPVHLYGNPSNMEIVLQLAKKKNIKIIEDCAQAHGTKFKKKHVGTFGDLGTFSFFPGKNLGAYGDGGCIVTNNKKLAERCLRLRNHGSIKKHDHQLIGKNSRLDAIQSAILDIKLKTFNKDILNARTKLAKIYFKELKEIKEIQLIKKKKYAINAYHQFVIRTAQRDKLKKYLSLRNIQTMIHYPQMLPELKIFKKQKGLKKIFNAKKLGNKILSLPISQDHSVNEIKYISKEIKNFFNKKLD